MTEKEYREHLGPKVDAVKTKEDLIKLLDEITTYNHDYGTIVIGMAAGMDATMRFIDRSPNGGITGFQASCIAWEMIPKLMMIRPPARIVDYNNMLYPQYEDKFNKTITPSIFKHLQDEAKRQLGEETHAREELRNHWQSIVDGKVPFGYLLDTEN